VTKRQDGKETRLRLLASACEEFSNKGYRDAKVADICKRAGANMASVNYYFGDKASLYVETWKHVYHLFEGKVQDALSEGSPEEKLRQYIEMIIKDYTSEGATGNFSRLYLMELVNPTGLIQDFWDEMLDPRRQKLHDIIRSMMGDEPDDTAVVLCELSIVNQCRVLSTFKRADLEYFFGRPIDKDIIRRLVDHITDFSLAGIKRAVGQKRLPEVK
jgi:AcrR family transcriptional regulator